MRRRWLMVALLAIAASAGSQETAPRAHYLFGQPRLLTQQLIWGLAHGVKLLATACDTPPVAKVYAEWLERQHGRIEAAKRDLAQHYFNRDTASDEALTAVLHLKSTLDRRPDEIAAACATFAQAIASERYDLKLFYSLRRDAARIERAKAVRARVERCLKRLPAESAAALTAQFSTWTRANGELENVSRSRVLEHVGNVSWQQDAGAGAQPPAVTCAHLAAALDRPAYALAGVFRGGGK